MTSSEHTAHPAFPGLPQHPGAGEGVQVRETGKQAGLALAPHRSKETHTGGSWPSSVKGANAAEGDAGLRCLHVAFPGLAGAEAMCSTRLPQRANFGQCQLEPGAAFLGLGLGGGISFRKDRSGALGRRQKRYVEELR